MLSLELDNVDVAYSETIAVRDASFAIEPSKVTAILGSNGAGKSSLLKAIMGLARVDKGTVRVGGVDMTRWPTYRIVQQGVTLCPEGRRLFASLSVMENLKVGAHLIRERASIAEGLDYVFSLFPKLQERRRQVAGYLSGGEQQMVAIGRALMSRPKVLLLDEPTLGLAPKMIDEVAGIVPLASSGPTRPLSCLISCPAGPHSRGCKGRQLRSAG